jgi:hypothetical protein
MPGQRKKLHPGQFPRYTTAPTQHDEGESEGHHAAAVAAHASTTTHDTISLVSGVILGRPFSWVLLLSCINFFMWLCRQMYFSILFAVFNLAFQIMLSVVALVVYIF